MQCRKKLKVTNHVSTISREIYKGIKTNILEGSPHSIVSRIYQSLRKWTIVLASIRNFKFDC